MPFVAQILTLYSFKFKDKNDLANDVYLTTLYYNKFRTCGSGYFDKNKVFVG